MTTSGANSVSSGVLPKWQVALAVGAPVALGLGYMYYKSITKSSSKPDRGKSKSSAKNGTSRDKQISIDGECSTEVSSTSSAHETPLEKAQRYKYRGNELFKSGKYDEAISNYNKAIEICPMENSEDLATFYQNRAAAYENLQKYNAVKADCTKALELKPKYPKALLRRARALENCNELESALHDATAVCLLEGFNNKTALVLADNVLKQLGKQHAQEHLAQKKPIMPSKHFIKTYMSSFVKDPIRNMLQNSQSSSPGFLKIQEAMKNQKYDDIIQLCTEEMENIKPEELSHKMELLLLRATFYLLSGDHDTAISDFQTIIDTEASSTEVIVNALIKRASLYLQLENPEKSFNDFDWAVKIGPNFGDIYHHRGQVNLLLEKIEDAKADFDKAVELHPDCGIAYVQKCYTDYRYGIITRDVDATEKTMKNFEKAIKKFPDCVEGYTLYAHLLSETQNYSQADSLFAKATEIDPKNATIYVHRGILHLQCYANLEKGIEYINKALELDDKCEIAYETLGTIEVQRSVSCFHTQREICRINGVRISYPFIAHSIPG